MTLGSEFTFHPALRERKATEGQDMWEMQLPDANGKFATLVRVNTPEKVRALMNARDRKEGKHYRLVDASRPARRPRKTTAKPAATENAGEK